MARSLYLSVSPLAWALHLLSLPPCFLYGRGKTLLSPFTPRCPCCPTFAPSG